MCKKIADEVGKSTGQVLIRWSVQKGAISIPKSSSPDRIAQNIDAIDWTLSEEQLAVLVRPLPLCL